MDTKEKIDELFIKEIEKYMNGDQYISLPRSIKVEKDEIPDIERWKVHE